MFVEGEAAAASVHKMDRYSKNISHVGQPSPFPLSFRCSEYKHDHIKMCACGKAETVAASGR